MKNYSIYVLCAIVLFTIIEAKPYCSSCGDYDDGGQRGGGKGYGGQGGGNGGQRAGNGGQARGGGGHGGGNGGRGDTGDSGGDDYSDYDYSNIYKRPCRGRGCKNNYIGNGVHNTNNVYMYD